MSREKQIVGYLTTKLKPKNKIDCVAWLLLNVFGCKFCKVCRDKPCNIKDGETCTDNIANYIREVVKEEEGYRKQSEVIDEFANRLKETPIKCGLPLLGLSTKEEIEEYFNGIMLQVRDAIDSIAKKMKGGE